MAEYKGKLLKGLLTKASKCLMSDGQTSVEEVLANKSTDSTVSLVNADVINGVLVVQVKGVVISSSPNTWITLGTLPSDYKPKADTYSTAVTSSGKIGMILVNTSGEVKIRVTQTDSSYGYYGEIVTKSNLLS